MTRSGQTDAATADEFDRLSHEYGQFNENVLTRSFRKRIYRIIDRHVKPGSRVLDLGCGPGSDFDFWAQRGDRVVAVDISPQMLRVARQQIPDGAQIELVQSSLDALEVESGFDLVMLNFGVWNALGSRADVHRQVSSLLNTGGVVIAVVMPRLHLWALAERCLRWQWNAALLRLSRGLGVTSSGWSFAYLGASHFKRHWHIRYGHALGPLLPSPDQVDRMRVARVWSRTIGPLDSMVSRLYFLGGDHLVFVMEPLEGSGP